jgi:hypothetical protein
MKKSLRQLKETAPTPAPADPKINPEEIKKRLIDSAGDAKDVLDAEVLVEAILNFTVDEVKELISVTLGAEKIAGEIGSELESSKGDSSEPDKDSKEGSKEVSKEEKINQIKKDLSGLKDDDFASLDDEGKNKAIIAKFPEFEKYLKALRGEGFLKV